MPRLPADMLCRARRADFAFVADYFVMPIISRHFHLMPLIRAPRAKDWSMPRPFADFSAVIYAAAATEMLTAARADWPMRARWRYALLLRFTLMRCWLPWRYWLLMPVDEIDWPTRHGVTALRCYYLPCCWCHFLPPMLMLILLINIFASRADYCYAPSAAAGCQLLTPALREPPDAAAENATRYAYARQAMLRCCLCYWRRCCRLFHCASAMPLITRAPPWRQRTFSRIRCFAAATPLPRDWLAPCAIHDATLTSPRCRCFAAVRRRTCRWYAFHWFSRLSSFSPLLMLPFPMPCAAFCWLRWPFIITIIFAIRQQAWRHIIFSLLPHWLFAATFRHFDIAAAAMLFSRCCVDAADASARSTLCYYFDWLRHALFLHATPLLMLLYYAILLWHIDHYIMLTLSSEKTLRAICHWLLIICCLIDAPFRPFFAARHCEAYAARDAAKLIIDLRWCRHALLTAPRRFIFADYYARWRDGAYCSRAIDINMPIIAMPACHVVIFRHYYLLPHYFHGALPLRATPLRHYHIIFTPCWRDIIITPLPLLSLRLLIIIAHISHYWCHILPPFSIICLHYFRSHYGAMLLRDIIFHYYFAIMAHWSLLFHYYCQRLRH